MIACRCESLLVDQAVEVGYSADQWEVLGPVCNLQLPRPCPWWRGLETGHSHLQAF